MIPFYFLILMVPFVNSYSIDICAYHEQNASQEICNQSEKIRLNLEFPYETEASTETFVFRGQSLTFSILTAYNDTTLFFLLDFGIEEYKQEANHDVLEFVKELLPVVFEWTVMQIEYLAAFEFEGYNGANFQVKIDEDDLEPITKGKALLMNDQMYFWFVMAVGDHTDEKITNFLESYSLTEVSD